MKRSLVIVGCGGFAREVLDVARAMNQNGPAWDVTGFVADDAPNGERLRSLGLSWHGPIDGYLAQPSAEMFVVGIGDPKVRSQLASAFEHAGLEAATLIHPSATMGADVQIEAGSVISSHVSITTNVRIGRHVHVNLNSTVGHDTVIKDFVTINPLVSVSGGVTLGERTLLGTHSCILQGIVIGEGSTVGAGAVVIRNVEAQVTVIGVPAIPRA